MIDTRIAPLALALLASCSGSDAPPAVPDGPPGANAPLLWLAGINGSESNLHLIETGPPSPF